MANPDPTTAGAPPGTGGITPTHTTGSGATAGAPPFVPVEPDPLPAAIGPYRVLTLLGRGGMGAVYRAEDPALRREVAVKVMLPRAAAHAVARARFVREARAQAKVEHDHVAAVFQVGEHAGLPFIAMPLLKGVTLAAALKANPRPPVYGIVRIAREIAEGLAAAHEKGLVHRDIKPSNVWLEGSRLRVKLLDFGIARPVGEAEPDTEAEAPLSADGEILGTPAYMSPEQTRGEPVDARTDLWSLGVVLYQMTAGRRPFTSGGTVPLAVAIAAHHPTPVRELAPDLPPALGDLIGRLLAKAPANRPPSVAAVADELRQIELGLRAGVRLVPLDTDPFAGLEATETGDPPSDTADRTPAVGYRRGSERRSFPVWVVVAAVLVAAGAVIGFVVVQFGKRPVETGVKPVEVVNEKPVPPKRNLPVAPPPVPISLDPERRAAELFGPYADLQLRMTNSDADVTVIPGQLLPHEPFKLVRIDMNENNPAPPAHFAARAHPALLNLAGLADFLDSAKRLRWSDDDLARFAESPSKDTLIRFAADFDPSPNAWEVLKQFRLASLTLFGAAITDEQVVGLPQLGECVRLDVLDLGQSGKLTVKGWAAVLHVRGASTLGLVNPKGLTPEVCKVIAAVPDLGSLYLHSCTLDGDSLRELARTPNLRYFALRSGTIPDDGLKHLAGATNLRDLDLTQTKLSASAVETLATFSRLQHLALSGAGVTEEQARKLNAALPRCVIVWDRDMFEPSDAHWREAIRLLRRGGFTLVLRLPDGKDVTVAKRGDLPDGRFLLTGVRGDSTPFGDDDLKRLADLGSLTSLQLRRTAISDDSVGVLVGLANLAELNIAGTRITAAGVKTLHEKLPKCKIEWAPRDQ